MTRRLIVLIATIGLLTVASPGSAAAGEAGPPDCDGQPDIPRSREAVRGLTFIGRVSSSQADRPFDQLTTYRFSVRVAYAGSPGRSIDIVGGTCGGLAFDIGHEYLFSWRRDPSYPYPIGNNAVVWELDGDEVRLIGIEAPASDYPKVFRDAASLAEVLRIVAPGADARLPETATDDRTPEDGSERTWLLLLIAAVTFIVAFGRRQSPMRDPRLRGVGRLP